MFLEVRQKGKNKKYYLVHSFRLNKKHKKIRRYLGANLSTDVLEKHKVVAKKHIEEQLEEQRKISDPFKTALSSDEFSQLKFLNVEKPIKILHLSKQNWKEFTERFTYDTNAIEGSTVTLLEVKRIVEKHEWPKFSSREDVSETYGVADAVDFIRKTKTHISVDIIKKLHKITFQNSKSYAGKLRSSGVEVVIRNKLGEVIHHGAPSRNVYGLLVDLMKWYHKNRKKYPPIVLATVVHNQFETIHPFQDGNGRVGRLLLNNILVKHGLPPINIQLRNRGKYYAALQAYQKQGNIRPTIELMLKEYADGERRFRKR